MHSWGDDWPHWDTLYRAQNWIINTVKKETGSTLLCKEKWGSLRYEHMYEEPEGIDWDTVRQWKALKKIVYRAIKKWPEIKDELLCDLASREEIVGKRVHDKYWVRVK